MSKLSLVLRFNIIHALSGERLLNDAQVRYVLDASKHDEQYRRYRKCLREISRHRLTVADRYVEDTGLNYTIRLTNKELYLVDPGRLDGHNSLQVAKAWLVGPPSRILVGVPRLITLAAAFNRLSGQSLTVQQIKTLATKFHGEPCLTQEVLSYAASMRKG